MTAADVVQRVTPPSCLLQPTPQRQHAHCTVLSAAADALRAAGVPHVIHWQPKEAMPIIQASHFGHAFLSMLRNPGASVGEVRASPLARSSKPECCSSKPPWPGWTDLPLSKETHQVCVATPPVMSLLVYSIVLSIPLQHSVVTGHSPYFCFCSEQLVAFESS